MAMRIDVVSLFPEMVEAGCAAGITGRALERELLTLQTWNPRDYTTDRHRTVDDRPYGGGPGMVMMVEPLRSAIKAAKVASGSHKVIYMSPQGQTLDQNKVRALAQEPGLILVAGRYEGVDERLMALEIDEELSIGDYVLSGGELAALVVIDAVCRLQPGALGDEDSAQQDSFMDGLLDCPHFTRPEKIGGPEEIEGLNVPEVLLSGDHARIRRWRLKQALGRTQLRRPELLQQRGMTDEERELLDEFMLEQQDKAT